MLFINFVKVFIAACILYFIYMGVTTNIKEVQIYTFGFSAFFIIGYFKVSYDKKLLSSIESDHWYRKRSTILSP